MRLLHRGLHADPAAGRMGCQAGQVAQRAANKFREGTSEARVVLDCVTLPAERRRPAAGSRPRCPTCRRSPPWSVPMRAGAHAKLVYNNSPLLNWTLS